MNDAEIASKETDELRFRHLEIGMCKQQITIQQSQLAVQMESLWLEEKKIELELFRRELEYSNASVRPYLPPDQPG